jgi:hypothetical protein
VCFVLAKQEMEPYLHHLIEFELEYLPPVKKQEEEIPLDVGKDDCDTKTVGLSVLR